MTTGGPLKIGITCYPSVGGAASSPPRLGEELARRGHEVHFISYERPFRFPENAPRIHFHPVIINDYDLFKYPDYTLPLSVKMAEVSRDHRSGRTPCSLCRAPRNSGHSCAVDASAGATAARRYHAAWHGHHVARAAIPVTDRQSATLSPARMPLRRCPPFYNGRPSDCSRWIRPIDVIHNFFAPRPADGVRATRSARPGRARRNRRASFLQSSSVEAHRSAARNRRAHPPARFFKLVILAGGDFTPFAARCASAGP